MYIVLTERILNFFFTLLQGGMSQVRFQPRTGKLLAAASENVVAIYDVETETCLHSLQVDLIEYLISM